MFLLNRIAPVLFATLVVFAGCKHTRSTTASKSNSKKPVTAQNDPRGGKSIDKVKEESVFVRGCTERMIGNPREAVSAFRECLEMNPENAAANYELAGLYLQLGQPDRAMAFAQKATALSPENTWYQLRYAHVLQANGKYDDAANMLEKIANTQPPKWTYQLEYADALSQAGKYKEALSVYDEIEKQQGPSDTLGQLRIRTIKKTNDQAAVFAAYEKQIAAFPYDSKNYLQLGDEYLAAKQNDKAIATYRRLLAVDPNNGQAHLALANQYQRAGQAIDAYNETVLAFTSRETPIAEKIALLNTYYAADKPEVSLNAQQRREADTLCAILSRVHADDAATWKIKGDYFYRDKNWIKARSNYRTAVKMDADNWDMWKRMLEINDVLKDTASQRVEAATAMELFPSQPISYLYYGQLMLQQQHWKDAVGPLATGASYVTDDNALEIRFYEGLITAYRKQDKNERADDYCEKALRLDPNNTAIALEYAFSLLDRYLKPVRAEELAQNVLTKNPENADALEATAWSKYQLGNYTDAKSMMEKALGKTPNDARKNERMGDIQHALNNDTEAVRYWKKAREKSGPNPALDRKIERRKLEHEE